MADLDAITARADAATEGPWFYDSYSGVRSQPKMFPFDEWTDPLLDAGHTLERVGICVACDRISCRYATECYDRDPVVAGVPAHHGDTAIRQRCADAEFIAHARTDVPELVDEVRALRAELERIRADVTRLCDEAAHYNKHIHKGPTATDSVCVPECRTFAVWTLNPREVQAALAWKADGRG